MILKMRRALGLHISVTTASDTSQVTRIRPEEAEESEPKGEGQVHMIGQGNTAKKSVLRVLPVLLRSTLSTGGTLSLAQGI